LLGLVVVAGGAGWFGWRWWTGGGARLEACVGRVYVPYLPARAEGERAPIALAFHGSGPLGRGAQMIRMLRPVADRHGFVVVAPDAPIATEVGPVWGVREDDADPPALAAANACLAAMRAHLGEPSGRVMAIGHSAGGLAAAQVGTHLKDVERVVALHGGGYVPGAMGPRRPHLVLTGGAEDEIRPTANLREHVVAIRRMGWRVEYQEFAGGHLPTEGELEAVVSAWLSE